MRVFNSTIGRVRDGQMEAAIAIAGEAATLVGRHGGDVRFFLAGAGGDINSTLFSIDYDSPEAMGQAFDALATDADLPALMARLNAAGSPSEITAQIIGMELPVTQTQNPGKGSILEVHTGKIDPSRIEEAISQDAEVCAFVEANGAVNARLLQLTYAGPASGMTAFTWELENMQAHARLASAWFSPAGLALQATMTSGDPANVPVSSALYNEVPL